MRKSLNLLFLFLAMFSSFCIPVYADEYPKYGIVKTAEGNGIKVRKEATTASESLGTGAGEGDIVVILDTVSSEDTNCSGKVWYKIKYVKADLGYGYACGDFVNVLTVDNEFDASLEAFPESYRPYLKALHSIYPNATFVPYRTELDFNTVINNENNISNGLSLVWDSNNTRNGLKNLNTYNYITNTFKNNYPGGGVNWYAASYDTIAYYVDPRNFLNEIRVFMFESLSYNPLYFSIEGIETILKGSFMYNAYVDDTEEIPEENKKKFSEVIMEAGAANGISPYYIASRIIQEVGTTRSSLVLGTYPSYPEYDGYYNFYNFGAGGNDVVRNGLETAKRNDWNSEEKAIISGASIIFSDYVNTGQDTNYFQKWDVICKEGGKCYNHQYMQNIEAPYSEASKTYTAYKNGLKEKMYDVGYVFTIPIYENMPDITILPSSLNPINYLKELLVNDNKIKDFNSLVYDYEITIPGYIQKINIKASGIIAGVGITGVGDIDITQDKQVIPINVTALNGKVQTYNITVNLNNDYKLTIDDTIVNIKSDIKDNYLYSSKNIEELKEAILNVNSAAIVEIKTKSGEDATILATGNKVKIIVGEETQEYEVVVFGDPSGDGKVTAVDYATIKNKIMGNLNLDGAYELAADVNGDGQISAVDYANVKNYIMGNNSVIKR